MSSLPFGGVPIVNYNDGEDLLYSDLNLMQSMQQALFLDQFLGRQMQVAPSSLKPSSGNCYAQGGNIKVSSGMVVTNDEGFIFTCAPDSNYGDIQLGPEVKAYALKSGELSFTVPAAHASQDRVDFICVKIQSATGDSQTRDFEDASTHALSSQTFNKKVYTTLATQYVQGSTFTAGGTPSFPSVPAGYTLWAGVYVTHSMSSVANVNLLDYRFPLRFKSVYVNAFQAMRDTKESGLTFNPNGSLTNSGMSAINFYFRCPVPNGRVLAINCGGTVASSSGFKALTSYNDTSNDDWTFYTSTGSAMFFNGSGQTGNLNNPSGVGGETSLVGTNLFPYWGQGMNVSLGPVYSTIQNAQQALMVQAILQAGETIKGVRFDIAY